MGNCRLISWSMGRVGKCNPLLEPLVSFQLQVEPDQGSPFGADSAANGIKFKCRRKDDSGRTKTIGHAGFWGSFGSWSEECQKGTAICGLRTKVEPQQGGFWNDDSALNDVQFVCCNLLEA